MKAYVGTKVLPHSFWTSPLDWSVLLAQRPGCFTPDLKACGTRCRPSRFRSWSGRLKKKNPLPLLGTERFLGRPADCLVTVRTTLQVTLRYGMYVAYFSLWVQI